MRNLLRTLTGRDHSRIRLIMRAVLALAVAFLAASCGSHRPRDVGAPPTSLPTSTTATPATATTNMASTTTPDTTSGTAPPTSLGSIQNCNGPCPQSKPINQPTTPLERSQIIPIPWQALGMPYQGITWSTKEPNPYSNLSMVYPTYHEGS